MKALLLNPNWRYVPSFATDLHKSFRRFRLQQKRKAEEAAKRRKKH